MFICVSLFYSKNFNIKIIDYSDQIFILMMVPGIDMFRLFIFRILKKKSI